jgi:recombination protein RecA
MSTLKLLSDSALRKKYPNSARADILLPDEKFLWLPSRSVALNWQLGGGIPYGRIVEIFGYESTGKSLLATDFAAVTQALGGVVLWGDAEGTFNPHWAKKNGLDPSKVEVYDSNDVEGYSDWHRDMIIHYRSKLVKNEPILLVLDSIAALDCLQNLNESQVESKAEMGNRAKAIYKMYRYRNHFYKQMGVTVIMINQVRKKLNASMFENADTTPGGDSTKFYASQRIGIQGGKQIKGTNTNGKYQDSDKGIKIGRVVYIQIVKNKVAPPKNSLKTEVYFMPDKSGYTGFSRYHGLPEILELEGVLKKKKGSGYLYKDKLIARGEDSLLLKLMENEKMRKVFIAKAGINTISKTREKLNNISHNLFPVKLKELKEE